MEGKLVKNTLGQEGRCRSVGYNPTLGFQLLVEVKGSRVLELWLATSCKVVE